MLLQKCGQKVAYLTGKNQRMLKQKMFKKISWKEQLAKSIM